jgi:hypothetical protein
MICIVGIDPYDDDEKINKYLEQIKSINGIVVLEVIEDCIVIYIKNYKLSKTELESTIEHIKKNTYYCVDLDSCLSTAEVKYTVKTGVYNITIKMSLIKEIKDLCVFIDPEIESDPTLNSTPDPDILVYLKIYIKDRENVTRINELCTDGFLLEQSVKD